MSISKRSFGVEGFKSTKEKTISLSEMKSAAPEKIQDFVCIDRYKKGDFLMFIYENLVKRHIFIRIPIVEIDSLDFVEEFVNEEFLRLL